MTEEKIKLREHIQKVKNSKIENNLTSKDVLDMFHFNEKYDELTQLMHNSNKTVKEIKESIGTTQYNWNMTFKGRYSKLDFDDKSALSKCLEMSYEDLDKVIKRDIEKQKK